MNPGAFKKERRIIGSWLRRSRKRVEKKSSNDVKAEKKSREKCLVVIVQ
jgi:hypothetical protein